MTPEEAVVAERLLTTTRSVRRRLDLDRPVDVADVVHCLRIALQAPTGSNRQGWRWIVVTDPANRSALAELYRAGGQDYVSERLARAESREDERVFGSAQHLLDVMDRVPVLVVPCIEGRVEGLTARQLAGLYGSVLPAAWSFMLALRTKGLATSWTTFHLRHEAAAARLLGIPDNVTQVALFPVAHALGEDFGPALRRDVSEVVFAERWGVRVEVPQVVAL